jgi:hypothetical protein
MDRNRIRRLEAGQVPAIVGVGMAAFVLIIA